MQERSRAAARRLRSRRPRCARGDRRHLSRQPRLPARRSRAARSPSRLGAAALAGLVACSCGLARRRERAAFLGSCAFLAGLSAATAAAVYPVMLRSDGRRRAVDDGRERGAGPVRLRVALGWFRVGFPLALAYLAMLFRMHRGKAVAARRARATDES
jgi:cytochrome bd-type quinol oxidase subunit 2